MRLSRQVTILLLTLLVLPLRGDVGPLQPLIERVEQLRGQQFAAEVERREVRRGDLRKMLEAQIRRDLPIPPADYFAVLRALHLVDQTATLESLLDLYDAQVLAFYDPGSSIYYSIDEPPAGVTLLPQLTEAVAIHELVHALQDQRFEAGNRLRSLEGNWDAQIAYHALVEGEALLVMFAHLLEQMGMSLDEAVRQEAVLSAIEQGARQGQNLPAGTPPYFVESLTFPYVQGLRFVAETYKRGGWEAVDELHRQPPGSSEEVFRPELYFERRNRPLADASAAPSARDPFRTVGGEFHWRFLLGEKAAKGWNGDSVEVRDPGKRSQTVLVMTSWDSESDAVEFEQAYRAFLGSKKARNVRVARSGQRVAAGYGADTKAIRNFVKLEEPGR